MERILQLLRWVDFDFDHRFHNDIFYHGCFLRATAGDISGRSYAEVVPCRKRSPISVARATSSAMILGGAHPRGEGGMVFGIFKENERSGLRRPKQKRGCIGVLLCSVVVQGYDPEDPKVCRNNKIWTT